MYEEFVPEVQHHPDEMVSQIDLARHRAAMEVCRRIFEELHVVPGGQVDPTVSGALPGYPQLVLRLHITPMNEDERRTFTNKVYKDPATAPPISLERERLIDTRVRYYHMERYIDKRVSMRRHPSFQEPDDPNNGDQRAA